jgi:hypothetical protein
MKIYYFALGLLAVGGMFFSGCATDTTTTTQTQTDPSKRVYTQDELRKSGETNPAAALEKTDPSVRMVCCCPELKEPPSSSRDDDVTMQRF